MAESYDKSKTWRGRSYTGMKVGRTHTWDYEGQWKERKIGPDLWEVDFRATKTRKGKGAPEGSGAPVGTEYLWFFAPTAQAARKMKSWDFEWGKTGETARQRAIRALEQALADLKAEERAKADPYPVPELEGERPAPPKRTRKKAPAKRAKKAAAHEAHARGKAEA